MKHLKYVVGMILAASVFLAQAVPVTANSPDNSAGKTVTINLHDESTVGLVGAATITVTYDPTKLRYVSGVAGSLIDEPATGLDLADVIPAGDLSNPYAGRNLLIAFLLTSAGVPNGSAGTLLSLDFEIATGLAAGTETFVYFNCFEFLPGECAPASSLDFVFDGAASKVTVLADPGSPLPLPGTLPLLGLGVAALLWARRRVS